MPDASRFGKWRQLEYPVSAEHVFIPNPRAHLEVHHEQIVVDEPAGAVAAQRFLIGEQALVAAQARLRPEWHLVTSRLVLGEKVTGQSDSLADGKVLAQFPAEAVVGKRTAESALRIAVVEPPQRARARDIHRVARVVLNHRLLKQFAAAVDTLLMREQLEDRRYRVEAALLDSHVARTFHQRQLPAIAQVQCHDRLPVELFGRVVGLVAEVRVVTKAVEALGGILLEKETPFERPPLLVFAAGLIIEIDLARDRLLRAGDDVPINIRRRICQVAKVPARAKGRSEE